MNFKAKLFVSTMFVLAIVVLGVAAVRWNPANLQRFVLLFVLAMLASAMKIRLPGFKTTISLNFVFVLVGIALFGFGETVLIRLGGALVQSFWKSQTRPKPVQVFFNAACLSVFTAAAFAASPYVVAALRFHSLGAMMVLGAAVYVALNTGLVSLVISLTEQLPLRELWASCYDPLRVWRASQGEPPLGVQPCWFCQACTSFTSTTGCELFAQSSKRFRR